MQPPDWRALLEDLELAMGSIDGSRMKAQDAKRRIEKALASAEAASADDKIINSLDHLLILATEAAKENVCTNTKCPYYNKKCKMR